MTKTTAGILAVVWVALAAPAYGQADVQSQPMIGQAAPTFRLQTVTGGTFDLADQQGRWLVVHFGASW